MIDLRSDTVTRPTQAMLDAMMSAKVGDDVYGEDDAVNSLQRHTAEMFGMESALFCPSGTMTNQIGIRVHVQPGDEVVCHELSHVYLYEGGGIASNSGCSTRLLRGDNGKFTAEQLAQNINPSDDSHSPLTRLVTIENTTNMGGGSCWDIASIEGIREVCDLHGLRLHLDGGMRQAGYLAAAGTYALEHHVDRLREDHDKARKLGDALRGLSYVREVLPVETNIVIFELDDRIDSDHFLDHLIQQGIRALSIKGKTIRFVFHLDITDAQFDKVTGAIGSFR